MAVKIYHGDILFTPSADRLEIHENSYIVVEEGHMKRFRTALKG